MKRRWSLINNANKTVSNSAAANKTSTLYKHPHFHFTRHLKVYVCNIYSGCLHPLEACKAHAAQQWHITTGQVVVSTREGKTCKRLHAVKHEQMGANTEHTPFRYWLGMSRKRRRRRRKKKKKREKTRSSYVSCVRWDFCLQNNHSSRGPTH